MNYYYRTALESQGGKIELIGNRIEVSTKKEIDSLVEKAEKKSEKKDKINEVLFFLFYLSLLTLAGLGLASILY